MEHSLLPSRQERVGRGGSLWKCGRDAPSEGLLLLSGLEGVRRGDFQRTH